MTLRFDFIENSELPYRVMIDDCYGAGITEKKAIMAALRVGKFIPEGMTNTKLAYTYIFWNYEVDEGWAELIKRLSR